MKILLPLSSNIHFVADSICNKIVPCLGKAAVSTFYSHKFMIWSDCVFSRRNRFGYNFYKVGGFVGVGGVVLRGGEGVCRGCEWVYCFLKMLYYFLKVFV